MKVLIINGSPKGKYSITLHTCLFLKEVFKEHEFEILNVGQQIKRFEIDMKDAIDAINRNDLIVFSYPVYTFVAPSQLHRFINLLKEQNIDLSSKFATQISTSKHFYDVTAHKYIEENCYDLNIKYIKGLSADMEDLTKKSGQKEAINFFKFVIYCVDNNIYESKNIENFNAIKYIPLDHKVEKNNSKNVVLVADLSDEDSKLKIMIDDFIDSFKYNIKVVNINKFNFHGGCLGCFNCASDGKCIYKDNFDTFLRNEIQVADAIVIAFTIKDHSMGYKFKMYDDRQFCNGHRTVTEGMPFAYIVNGNYQQEQNLNIIIDARAEVGHNYLAGVAYDNKTMTSTIEKLQYSIESNYVTPRNFYGVGGMKIFRDLIWIMRGIMKADHKFYKKHGVYDFPQKQRGKMMLMCFLGSLMRNKKIKAKMGNKMNEGMVAPYQKVIKKVKENH